MRPNLHHRTLATLALAATLAPVAWGQEHHEHPRSQGMHHDFSDVERYTRMFDAADRIEWQRPEELLTALEVGAGMTVADVGAGTGFFLPYLAAAVGPSGRVVALDVEPRMVEFMQQRIAEQSLEAVTASIIEPDDPGLEAGSVDRILIVNVWHHIDDRGAYAVRLHEALSADGTVAVVDYDADAPHGPPKKHRLAPEQVKAELEAGGLRVRILEEALPHQYVVVGSR